MRVCARIGHRIGDGLRPMMNETRRAANVELEIRRSPKIADSKERGMSSRLAIRVPFAPDVDSSSAC